MVDFWTAKAANKTQNIRANCWLYLPFKQTEKGTLNKGEPPIHLAEISAFGSPQPSEGAANHRLKSGSITKGNLPFDVF